jgi:hypothetical protein
VYELDPYIEFKPLTLDDILFANFYDRRLVLDVVCRGPNCRKLDFDSIDGFTYLTTRFVIFNRTYYQVWSPLEEHCKLVKDFVNANMDAILDKFDKGQDVRKS